MSEWIYFINEEIEAHKGKSFDLTNPPGLAREIHAQVSKLLLIQAHHSRSTTRGSVKFSKNLGLIAS